MKDIDLRGIVLQQFYDHRRKGLLGIFVAGMDSPTIPPGADEQDVLRICSQLGEYGLLDWDGFTDERGGHAGGCGTITAAGVDVIEGGAHSPIPIHVVDNSRHEQTINITGTQGGVQVAGAHSSLSQNITQDLEKMIAAINSSNVTEGEKKEAKSRLATFLESSAVSSLLGAGAKALIDACCR